jgi:UDPglucose 6-dehydrogenase
MLATRISFMNMMAQLCAEVGADIDLVRRGIGSDARIGNAFLFAGCGYGGSCFPKDVKALIRTVTERGVDAGILKAVERVNDAQKRLPLDQIESRFGADLSGRTVGVWGLSFKPETDDMREAPSLTVVEGLLERGAAVRVYDPEAMEVAHTYFGDRVSYARSNYEAVEGADALVILTEWQPFRRPDLDRMRTLMRMPIIIDGRNLFEPAKLREEGFEYYSVGRPPVAAVPAAAD